MNTIILLFFLPAIWLCWLCYRIFRWRVRIAKLRRTMPVAALILEPYALIRRLIPYRFQKWHPEWLFHNRNDYDYNGPCIFAVVSLFGYDKVYTADADAILEVATNVTRFPKDLKLYGILDIYGRNVVTTEGAEWRLHRKITARPFSEKNNQLVHAETVRQATEMMASWESRCHDGAVVIDKLQLETMKFALHVIIGAGYGMPFSWDIDTQDIWPNHKLSFRDAVDMAMHHLFAIVALPKIFWKLPIQYLRDTELGYNEFGAYMRELLERERQLGDASDGQNLLSALVKNSATEKGEQGALTDDEIIGNTFIFLIAGHETTAHTLLYAFLMLALHPEVQETLFSEVRETLGDRIPTYDDFPNLVYPLCVMFETLRLFPPVMAVPKCPLTKDEMVLGKHCIPKDVTIHYDVLHIHRHPKYWGSDAEIFNPSRFDGRNVTERVVEKDTGDTSPGGVNEKIKLPVKGAFIPFSEGSRSCLGRKFAQVEFVTCLVMVIQKWRIELKDWTPEQAWDVIDKSGAIITLAPPKDIPLVLKRRSVK